MKPSWMILSFPIIVSIAIIGCARKLKYEIADNNVASVELAGESDTILPYPMPNRVNSIREGVRAALPVLSLDGDCGDKSDRMAAFLRALRCVESGDNPEATGDDGRARGAFQCHAVVFFSMGLGINDYNTYVTDDRYMSSLIIRYWQKFCPMALQKQDWRTLARVWHCGPKGVHAADPTDYPERVMNLFEEGN